MSDVGLMPDPDGPPPAAAPGPIVQSAAIGFRVVFLVTLMLSVVWFGSNFRIISSDSQAVVMSFGRIVRTQKAGLLLAWPRPIDEIRLLPGPDRQLSHAVAALPAVGGVAPASSDAGSDTVPASASPYLTGDGNVVLLDAALIYRITDPAAYVLSQSHVAPAMDRIFRASAVQVTAGQGLNAFLVAQPISGEVNVQTIDALRSAVRENLIDTVNAHLRALAAQGDGLGVEVDRIDVTAWLPPEAKLAFDARADRRAESRPERRRRLHRRRIAPPGSAARGRSACQRRSGCRHRAHHRRHHRHHQHRRHRARRRRARRSGATGLSQRIGGVLAKAGAVVVIDPKSGQRVWLNGPGKLPAPHP